MHCPKCGMEVPFGAKTCDGCGAQLPPPRAYRHPGGSARPPLPTETPTTASQPPGRRWLKPYVLISCAAVLAAVVVLVVLLTTGSSPDTTQEGETINQVEILLESMPGYHYRRTGVAFAELVRELPIVCDCSGKYYEQSGILLLQVDVKGTALDLHEKILEAMRGNAIADDIKTRPPSGDGMLYTFTARIKSESANKLAVVLHHTAGADSAEVKALENLLLSGEGVANVLGPREDSGLVEFEVEFTGTPEMLDRMLWQAASSVSELKGISLLAIRGGVIEYTVEPSSATPWLRAERSIADVVEEVKDSVVTVLCEVYDEHDNRINATMGTGFFISDKGDVMTAAHIVTYPAEVVKVNSSRRVHRLKQVPQRQIRIFVITSRGKTYPARVISGDVDIDYAVIHADILDPARGVHEVTKPVKFGNSDELRQGDQLIQIGNPLNIRLAQTVTTGIVSHCSRRRVSYGGAYVKYFQSSIITYKGNSGGPTFNMKGEVVGIIVQHRQIPEAVRKLRPCQECKDEDTGPDSYVMVPAVGILFHIPINSVRHPLR